MDPRTGFGVLLVLAALGGLAALATGRLQFVNGTIVIGAPANANTTSTSTTTTPAATPAPSSAGQVNPNNIGGANYSSLIGGNQASQAIASILGSVGANDPMSAYYSPTSTAQLVSTIPGDGVALNPLNPLGMSA